MVTFVWRRRLRTSLSLALLRQLAARRRGSSLRAALDDRLMRLLSGPTSRRKATFAVVWRRAGEMEQMRLQLVSKQVATVRVCLGISGKAVDRAIQGSFICSLPWSLSLSHTRRAHRCLNWTREEGARSLDCTEGRRIRTAQAGVRKCGGLALEVLVCKRGACCRGRRCCASDGSDMPGNQMIIKSNGP